MPMATGTALGAPSLLCRPSGRVLGVAPGTAPDDVVLTVASRGVFVYDLLTQMCRCNWSVSPGTALGGAAVVHPHPRRYTVVVDRSSLSGWHEDDRAFGMVQLRLGAPIRFLLRVGAHLTAAVHEDGSVSLADASLTQSAPALPLPAGVGKGARCVWAGVVEPFDAADAANDARCAGGELLLILTESASGSGARGDAKGGKAASSKKGGSAPVAEGSSGLQLHVLRVGRAGPAGAGADDNEVNC
ncbi:hypothetical protein T492DRAFT_850274 [Pavlovales sp. CCMP2436]|nr:hypothetical protein T492DRAFT_850274 [Pavlovales sp. CCMP2436]